jgi:type II secretory pathway pseudopilin PulG
LLEVIVAMAIFMISLGAIVPLIQIGQDRVKQVQLQSLALKKCESKLSELVTGSEQLYGQANTPFPDNPPDENWVWSCDVSSDYNGINNLWLVSVRVHREAGDNSSNTPDVSLTQLILDPAYRGSGQPLTNTAGSSGAPTTASAGPAGVSGGQ